MKIANEVLIFLDRAEKNGSSLVLVGQLDHSMYTKVNEVLELAGGKWNRKAKAHIFDGDALEAIEQIILTGEITKPQDFGFFPSPKPVVDRLIELAEISEGMVVLEPSAGIGNIVAGLHKAGAVVDAIELLDANIATLKEQGLATLIGIGDFLETPAHAIYDRVVMNPPFAKQADIKHVTHAMKFIKDGGLLISVMASSVMFRDNKLTADFRAMVENSGGLFEVLPEGSFKESGTMVNTVIVKIPKQSQI
jgi:predicted RNA methylase